MSAPPLRRFHPASMTTPAQAARELLARDDAVADLCCYATQIDIPNVPSDDDQDEDALLPTSRYRKLVAHHALICRSIQDTVDGSRKVAGQPLNLMLLFPPGSAKSTYADVVAVPWFMATRPVGRGGVILTSHSAEIAKKQGRRARQVIRSQRHRTLFPDAVLASDHGAADNWALSNGAEYLAAGITSGITGTRASLGIADDLIRGREAAESETQRGKVWDAYMDDFCSRLLPGAPQIMITTRWHQDDPAGRILPENWEGKSGVIRGRDGRAWNVLCCPAICNREDDPLGRKTGEGLWPEWFPASHWEPFKRNSRTWSSLYQQNPAPDAGTFFQRAWFDNARYIGAGDANSGANAAVFGTGLLGRQPSPDDAAIGKLRLPSNLRIYLTSDHARSADAGDYTVFAVWGVDTRADLWWLGGWRGRTTPDRWMQEVVGLVRLHRPFCWFAENDTIFGSVEPFIRRAMRDAGVVCRIEKLSTRGDKVAKAQSFQGMASMGRVHFPGTPEADAFVDELIRFPSGKNDDQVDCGANIGRALMEAHPAIVRQAVDHEPRRDGWGRVQMLNVDWRVA